MSSCLCRRDRSTKRHFPLCFFLPPCLWHCDSLVAKYKTRFLRGQTKKVVLMSVLYKNRKKIPLFWFHSSTTCPSGESLVMLTWKLFGTPWNLNICSRPQHLSTGRASLRLLHRFHLFLNIFLVKKKIPQQLQFFFFLKENPFSGSL